MHAHAPPVAGDDGGRLSVVFVGRPVVDDRRRGVPQGRLLVRADGAGLPTELTVPLSQMVFLLICTTVALLFGRVKLALLVNYLFALFWGYILNRELLVGSGETVSHFVYIYVVFGLAVVFLVAVGFLVHRNE